MFMIRAYILFFYTHLSYLELVSPAILENSKNNSAIKNNLSGKIMLDVNLL